MNVKDLIQNEKTVQGEFSINEKGWIIVEELNGWTKMIQCSPEYVFRNSVKIKIYVEYYRASDNQKYIQFLRFYNKILRPEDNLKYRLNISSKKLVISETILAICDMSLTRILSTITSDENNSFDLKIVLIDIQPATAKPFACLHKDTELIDFELRGEDGSVSMHKFALASSSSVLRRMLSGKWKETAEGSIEVPGTSLETLQHFKDYVYLSTLPSTGLQQLLLLAMYYMMPQLEHMCVYKLVDNMTPQNTCELFEFAVKHKANKLILAMLQSVQDGDVKISEIPKITDEKDKEDEE